MVPSDLLYYLYEISSGNMKNNHNMCRTRTSAATAATNEVNDGLFDPYEILAQE